MDLFEAAEAKKKKRTAGPVPAEVMTVSALTVLIKNELEARFARVCVLGQVSNLSRAASGHVYLTLKDEGAEIGAVMWRGVAERLPFKVEDGQEIIVTGKVAVYERRGRYQIVISTVQPKGIGALQLAFLQLKDKLEKEGLFDPAHKKPLPPFPETVAVVTSPTGAAVHDILTMIEGRMPRTHVLLFPVAVQGEQAAPKIAAAIQALNRMGGVDVMIVGRGGGSLEDLWPFNEEVVARAIHASEIPVISAVGHEVDVSISDLVADVRALTPTQAGEMVVPSRDVLLDRLSVTGQRLGRALLGGVRHARIRLDAMAQSYGMRAPIERIRQHEQRLDEIVERMALASRRELARLGECVRSRSVALEGLSPLNVLARGYSITTLAGDSRPLRSADEAPPGSRLRTMLHEGELESEVGAE